MGDPFTIAVSVAGLTSLGIQLAQGLKKYADSALDSKGRILAISIDIELAVQVIKTLEVTLQNTSSRVSMTDDAEKLAKDVIKQCQDLFDAIKEMLPDLKPIGLKKMDMIKWPTIESKVELFRSNLEKIKLTLQLLMSVMIYAAISSSTVQPETIAEQRLEIRRLLEEEATVETRLAGLRLQDERLASSEPQANMIYLQEQSFPAGRVNRPMDRIEEGAFPNTLPGHNPTSQTVRQPQHQSNWGRSDTLPKANRRSSRLASKKPDKNPDLFPAPKSRKRDYVSKFLGSKRQRTSALPLITEPEFEDPMQMLYHDYGQCLEQLSTLRAAIEVTSQISFRSEGDRVHGCRDAALTFELIDKVKWHGENTLDCVKACLMNSVAVHTIEQQAKASRQALSRDAFYKASYAEFLSRPEETRVVDGIPRSRSSVAPAVLEFDIRKHRSLLQLTSSGAKQMGFTGQVSESEDSERVDRSTGPSIIYALPSVDDLVHRWTNIRGNNTSVESGAASFSNGQLVTE
ncbi:hypothetical protein KCU65_g2289, partial [Aureobasidium melanogenum]